MGDLTVVFGVSGVGKTTACARLAQRHDDFRHITASELIGQVRMSPDRSIDQVSATQAEIVERIHRLRDNDPRRIILDGHCVIRLASRLYQVPNDVIAALAPAVIILVEAEPETILKRRSDRDVPVRATTVAEVAQELSLTRKTCLAYNHELSIPLKVFRSGESDLADQLFAFLT
ncbi:ATP-binding protein [Rhizobium leguminosarum]|uniref:ATP-binding protein n=1 Tax=Rhizobium leguminosarum TaxID=384 RepID=UPI0024B39312|nr:ATP-binding protein [Rhizobium leguminosarum]WHO80468.1 ATP-binding protein [Rhizobium leguminosarum]